MTIAVLEPRASCHIRTLESNLFQACGRVCRRAGRAGSLFRSRIFIAALVAVLLCPEVLGDKSAADSTNLASGIDLRANFQKWGLPLRLQGGRGTCSVFALTGALEYALASRQHTGTVLSVEFLNWASNHATTNSKDGGFFSDLWTGFEVYGICPETSLPYRENFDPGLHPEARVLQLAKDTAKARLRLIWIKPWNVATGLTEAQFLKIKRTLAGAWPVCGGFRWPKHEHWQNDVLEMAPASEVFDGHSVLLVGFKDDPAQPGGGIFLIRNSGGGVHDGALPYEYARSYLNDAAWIEPAEK